MIATEMNALVDRWLADPAFRADLRVDLVGTLRRAGFDLREQEVAALRRIPWHLSDDELIARARPTDSIGKIW